MADKKKKNQNSKKTTKRAQSVKKPAKTVKAKSKPAAKKSTAKATKQVKRITSKTGVKKPTVKATKQGKPKAAAQVKKAVKNPVAKKVNKAKTPKALKPDWNYENEVPKRGKAKDEIKINITPKAGVQKKGAKNVTKQVTDQLPENAKLRTIHLHFKID